MPQHVIAQPKPATIVLSATGSTDESRINAAITALNSAGGGKLFLRKGTYAVSSNPILVKSKVWIQGEGVGNTILAGGSGLGTNAVVHYAGADSSSPIVDCKITDLEIDGTNMPTNPVSTFRKGINIIYSKRLRLQNLYVHNTPATGIGPDYVVDGLVDNCVVESCGTSGQNPGYNGFGFGTGAYTNENVLVTNCHAINNLNNGFLLEYVAGGFNARHYSYVNCFAHGNNRGFRVSGASNVSFTNCHAYENTLTGFYHQVFGAVSAAPENVKLINCEAYANGADGIEFREQEETLVNAIIQGCHVYGNTTLGIHLAGNYASVMNNVCWSNGQTGIYYNGNSNVARTVVQIKNNIVYNNGTSNTAALNDGIRVRATSGTVSDVQITGNRCFDTQGTPTQNYGVALKDALLEVLVKDNDLRGNKTDAILLSLTGAATNIVTKNNKGWNPEQTYAQENVTGATTFNRLNGDLITATLTGNVTATVTNGKNTGDTLTLILTQDGTGSRTITWPSNVKLAGGALTLSTAASAVDTVHLRWDGTNWREVSRGLGSAVNAFTSAVTIDSTLAVKAGTSTGQIAKAGGTIFTYTTDAGNSTTTETDLYSDSIPANTLATNKDKLEGRYGGTFVSSGTATRQLRLYFGGTAIFDSGALSISLSASWDLEFLLARVSSTVVRYTVKLNTTGASASVYASVGELTGLTLSNANVLKITGQAAGVGAATGDIVAKVGSVEWKSAP